MGVRKLGVFGGEFFEFFLMKLALVQLATRCHCIPAGLPETALSKAPNLDTSSYRTKHSGQQAENRGERNEDLDVW